MSKKRAVIFLLLFMVLALLWKLSRKPESMPAPATPTPEQMQPSPKGPELSLPDRRGQTPVVPVPALPATPPPPVTFVIPPGQEGMHRELIPRSITIVRCYYDEEIVAPGTTFGFSINGSGFDEAFHKMIAVDMDALDVEVKGLRLVTANQIQGQIVVGADATTQYIHPKIIIRALPVFKAPEPFGVVRRGEILDIVLTGIDEGGQMGRFRILTNLDEELMRGFRVAPTTPHLDVSNLTPRYPFYVDGIMSIELGLASGEYGLVAFRGKREIFRKAPLVDVVRPNVGTTGSVEGAKAVSVANRPGDVIEILVRGSGFTPVAAARLSAEVDEFAMGPSSFTYVSAGRLALKIQSPMNAPVGLYGITLKHSGKTVYQRPTVFAIVPPNWLAGVRLSRPMSPGQSGTLEITGRDISPAYAQSLELQVDEPGLRLSPLRLLDASTLVADIQVSTAVAPGDYLVHVSAQGKPVKLPAGNIIKIKP
jgi:hypothetical protein